MIPVARPALAKLPRAGIGKLLLVARASTNARLEPLLARLGEAAIGARKGHSSTPDCNAHAATQRPFAERTKARPCPAPNSIAMVIRPGWHARC